MSVPAVRSRPVPEDQYITPEEQLSRLSVTAKIMDSTPLYTDIANLIAEYVGDNPFTHWHRALSRLKALPARIPPLSRNFCQTLDSPCPIYEGKKVRETHILMLILQEFRSLNHLEKNILKPYAEIHHRNENPLRFNHFDENARQEYGDAPFKPTHWVLMPKKILPGSRCESSQEQIKMIKELNAKAPITYEIISLQDVVSAFFLHQVATEERLCPIEHQLLTYTHVQESVGRFGVLVGSFFPSGLRVFANGYAFRKDIGVIVVAVDVQIAQDEASNNDSTFLKRRKL
jgi:hypothetical protein